MWHYTILHVLIALIPILALQGWLTRPGRMRYANAALSVACGVSMMLTMLVAYESPYHNPSFDVRVVPYVIGSLYGGIPAASILTVLYMAARMSQVGTGMPLLVLGLFFFLYVPFLFFHISPFQEADTRGRLKIVFRLTLASLPFLALQVANYLIEHRLPIWHFQGKGLLYGALFVMLAPASAWLIEIGFSRMALQIENDRLAQRYDSEVRRLQRFIDQSPLAVMFIDTRGIVSHLNDLAARLMAPLRREDILGRSYRAVMQAWQSEPLLEAADQAMAGERKITDLCMIRGRLYYTTICSLDDDPGGMLFIAHDMTEVQQLKDEVNRMERLSLVGQMAASITHEIRNPMAVIRGFVQLLNERSTLEQHSYFHIILQELDRANGIINDFLSLAQNRIVEKNVSDLHGVLEDLLPLLRADANMRGQLIELRLCEEMEPLELNVKEIKQLVLNLARNGMEAMDDKGVLRIETDNLPDAVELRVIDNGVGIPPEKLERLFEPFYTTKANGTGLGLALCLSIVERHNGKIAVRSAIGQGTTFVVSFGKPGRP